LYFELPFDQHFGNPGGQNYQGQDKSKPHFVEFEKFRRIGIKYKRDKEKYCIKAIFDDSVANINKFH